MSVSTQAASSVSQVDQHSNNEQSTNDHLDSSSRLSIDDKISINDNLSLDSSDQSQSINNKNFNNSDKIDEKNNDDKIDPSLANVENSNNSIDSSEIEQSNDNNNKIPIDESKKLFFTNLKDLTDNISLTLSEIHSILPKLYDQNHLFKIYSNFLSNSEYFQSYDDCINVLKNSSLNKDNIINNNKNNNIIDNNEDSINNDNNNNNNNNNNNSINNDENLVNSNISMNSVNQSNEDLFDENSSSSSQNLFNTQPIPLIPGTLIPDIDLNSQAKTVYDIWDEWTMGHKNKPPLLALEKKYGTRWRRGRIAKSAQRRKKVIEFIENEFKKHNSVIKNIITVVNDLENYRIMKGKGLFWLYGSLPDRLYDDAGNSLYQPVLKGSKESKDSFSDNNIANNSTSNNSSKITKPNHNNKKSKLKKLTAKENDLINNIDDALKNVDSVNKNHEQQQQQQQQEIQTNEQKSVSAAVAVAAVVALTNTSNEMDVDNDNLNKQINSKDIQNGNIDGNLNLVNTIGEEEAGIDVDMNGVEGNIEEEESDEEDEDNLPLAANVAAMASMSVEGEDDEHGLVDSAALAVAAQHVADQQRRRDQAKKDLNNYEQNHNNVRNNNNNNINNNSNHNENDDGLNENTDPALSKL
jgi:hypothetical protein